LPREAPRCGGWFAGALRCSKQFEVEIKVRGERKVEVATLRGLIRWRTSLVQKRSGNRGYKKWSGNRGWSWLSAK
jgi:hypothetical protein